LSPQLPDGVIELVDGLYLVAGYGMPTPSIPNYGGASVYLLRGADGGCVLIDSGFSEFRVAVTDLLMKMGVSCSDIRMVLYTHSHGDHMESYLHYQQHGAVIAVHEAARHAHRWGGTPVHADRFFRDGEVLEAAGLRIEAHHTPGHTPDSTCFLFETAGTRVLFAGDLTGWFFPSRGSDLPQMNASVEKARRLRADLICGGHWLCGVGLDAYWDKLAKSVREGIFQLVDRHHAEEHYAQTAARLRPGEVGSWRKA
jgi:glyoxylase-like metal-dependent hydrolase (beta-lactamase superfamily II)